ncbi:hypothetical protein [Glycomyces sp. MUSA5-2]|uniref:hypothetical protein n=1 Tax=Glycomyces sp. MUSA5-2 TaxID=2053002 RepID=UPI00300ABCBD
MPHSPSDIYWWRRNIKIENPQGKKDRIVISLPEHVDIRSVTDGARDRTYIVVIPRDDTA